jgi:hypothetical protein
MELSGFIAKIEPENERFFYPVLFEMKSGKANFHFFNRPSIHIHFSDSREKNSKIFTVFHFL